MKRIWYYAYLTGVLSALATSLFAQNSPTSADAPGTPPALTYAEQMPSFRGGKIDSVMAYIRRNTRYPAEAIEAGAAGKVFVTFVVNTKGQVEQAQVVKSVHAALDQEALRVISSMPATWQPGRQQGKPVAVAMTVPINFAMLTAKPAPLANAEAKYPGGPDALLAYLAAFPYPEAARTVQAQGRIFIKIKLDSEGRITEARSLASPIATQVVGGKTRATTEALNRMLEQAAIQWVATMPAWIPARKNGASVASSHITLPVVFPLSPGTTEKVYPYADQMPVFKNPVEAGGLQASIQRAATYPAQAMRNKVQGTVYVYFVVNEVGALEQAQIISSPGPELDASVLAAIRSQSAATTPAQHQGKPVKVFYIMPFNFRMI